MEIYNKITLLEKKIDKQEQYSRRNCVLLHGITDDIAAKAIFENINGIIITIDDINRSHKIGQYDLQKKYPRPLIVKLARDNVFSSKRKLKDKERSISESLKKMRLIKLKEARDRYTFANV